MTIGADRFVDDERVLLVIFLGQELDRHEALPKCVLKLSMNRSALIGTIVTFLNPIWLGRGGTGRAGQGSQNPTQTGS